MKYFWFCVAGLLSGVLGGMGMGGGTVLIPVLTIFLNFGQLNAQAINLISFLPMAIISLILHFKNKLVNLKGVLFMVIPAVALSIVGAVISNRVDSQFLKRAFGVFLILLSILQFLLPIILKKLNNKA